MAGLSTAPAQGSMTALNPGAGGSAPQPGQPPFGSSPGMTQPSAPRGMQSAALMQVQWAVRLLEQAIPAVGAASELGQDLIDVLKKLSKHVPPTPTSSGLMNSAMQQFMAQQKANAPQQDVMRALQQQGGSQQAAPPAAA